jgi:hypothetical protein
MQQDIETKEIAERRAKTIEATLVSHNPTVDRVLEACKRIQWSWTGQKEVRDERDN